MKSQYDIVVAGGGLGGLTAANRLACAGHKVLLAEQHIQLGGLATAFRRRNHIFDVALHGFPDGMRRSFRRYWGRAFSDQVVQVKSIRFHNPQYRLESTFDTADFSRKMVEHFRISREKVEGFFARVASMNYTDDQSMTTRELFQEYFPGRTDVWRFLMEPISYANGSTLDEPAISYGIVFGNFMSQGVYTFQGGTDLMLEMMRRQLEENGVDIQLGCRVEQALIEGGRVRGARIDGRNVACHALVSNGSLFRTALELAGRENLSPGFLEGLEKVRPSTSSCQVYLGIKAGEKLPFIGDLVFHSTAPEYDAEALCAPTPTSRTFSVYYPELRPGSQEYSLVASMNARYQDWCNLPPDEYRRRKELLVEDALHTVEEYVPNIRSLVDYTCAATPLTFQRYTGHIRGATFGTKFEGLKFSQGLPREIPGLFHTGSVGIIMSGWLGAMNYGVIVANEVDKYLSEQEA
ncbi:MAG: phytoene desaturase family protein [Oligosphaeraceae bacterium]